MKRDKKKKFVKNLKTFFVCLVLVYSVAFFGSLFTSSNVNSEWYNSVKPSITPPNYVFPIVWNILFLLIALSLYFAWINSDKKSKFKIALAFGANFVLNILWSALYFGIQNPSLAFYELILLEISILFMISTTYKVEKKSCYFLVPYLLWVTFAGVLNYLSAFN